MSRARGKAPSALKTIVDFSNAGEATLWEIVNDGVMGGVSDSRFDMTGQATGLFSGTLSLDNNGGFVSVRRSIEAGSLDGFQAFALRVRGDGRHYQLRARVDTAADAIAYRAEFDTAPGEWLTVYLPLNIFVPTWRGRRVDAPPLEAERICQIGFMLADGTPGEFRLEAQWIQAQRTLPLDDAGTSEQSPTTGK